MSCANFAPSVRCKVSGVLNMVDIGFVAATTGVFRVNYTAELLRRRKPTDWQDLDPSC